MTCLLVTLAAAAPAEGAGPVRRATFMVSVKGVQTNSWSIDRTTPGPCGGHVQGRGSERMTFSTLRPVRTTVAYAGTLVSYGRVILTQGVANRQGSRSNTPNPGECAGGGPGNQAPQPVSDCGRRSGVVDVQIERSFRRRGWILLTNGPRVPSVFQRCPIGAGGFGWPDVMETNTAGLPIEAPLPLRDLFNPALRKHLTIGRGTTVFDASGQKSTTSVRWELTFTRI